MKRTVHFRITASWVCESLTNARLRITQHVCIARVAFLAHRWELNSMKCGLRTSNLWETPKHELIRYLPRDQGKDISSPKTERNMRLWLVGLPFLDKKKPSSAYRYICRFFSSFFFFFKKMSKPCVWFSRGVTWVYPQTDLDPMQIFNFIRISLRRIYLKEKYYFKFCLQSKKTIYSKTTFHKILRKKIHRANF